MTHHLNLLAELPLPIAPGRRRFQSALDCIAQSSAHPPPQVTTKDLTNQAVANKAIPQLLTADSLGLCKQDWQKYKEKHQLVHLHHDIWVSPDQPVTRALRAESLLLLAPADYLYRIRFSRLSAAWVLGYTPQLPNQRIDIDYSRDNRCNLPRAYRSLFATHQTTVIPFDSISIGSIQVTTPLRTAVDLVSYHEEVEHLKAIQAILRDPQNTVSPQLFLKVLADKPNLRRSSYLRAEHLAKECIFRLQKSSGLPLADGPKTMGQNFPRLQKRSASRPKKN